MILAELLDILGYTTFPQYYLKTDARHNPDIAPLTRTARSVGIDGVYVFQSSPDDERAGTQKPAVYVAEAQTPEQARNIHRALWNLGQAPFLIVSLPDQVRVYTGFDYSSERENVGLLEAHIHTDEESLRTRLADFSAESINSGDMWRKRGKELKPQQRVDKRLLKNLQALGGYLREKKKLETKIAHSLIGKYVYLRYLRDQNILSDQWLQQHHIDIETVLGRQATVAGLRSMVKILEEQLNGSIFPLDFDEQSGLNNEIIADVASVFAGDQMLTEHLKQLSLDFKVYDFEFIPIETLSSIYEQFLHTEGRGKRVGAFYTPEYLADYLISEMQTVRPLKMGMTVFDPSCGSGVFLVLVYRRLIEMRLAQSPQEKLRIRELIELLHYLYGTEREEDACYVTEFSLILMLLHYADPDELLARKKQLPSLHNTQIFHCDFFDDGSPFRRKNLKFDWIIGNPPWIRADEEKDQLAITWIDAHKEEQPVGSQEVAEAFSWRIVDVLATEGCAGLILPAASLYNDGSQQYRRYFFREYEILKMTDFSNLRHVLFEGRATAPAATVLYRKVIAEREKQEIEHYGPFAINQIPHTGGNLWTITINENEIQTVSPYDAEKGDSSTWKFALWGTQRDQRAIKRLRHIFPETLGQLCEQNAENGWHLHEGLPLRKISDTSKEDVDFVSYLEGKKCLNTDIMDKSEHLFSVPSNVLDTLSKKDCFVRKGRMAGLLVAKPPHILMNASWKYVVYSDEYFVIKPRQIGLSVPQEDANYLRALSVFLSSSIARYYLFFQTASWGIERDRITLEDVKSIPVPFFSSTQVEQLAQTQTLLAQMEAEHGSSYTQRFVDAEVASVLNIPTGIHLLATEFMNIRVQLVGGGKHSMAMHSVKEDDVQAYAQEMVDELDAFTTSQTVHHKAIVTISKNLCCCTVEIVRTEQSLPVDIRKDDSRTAPVFAMLQELLRRQFSQWVYIQKGLRIFDGPRIHIFKAPYLINWTRTEALNDADDVIAEILTTGIHA